MCTVFHLYNVQIDLKTELSYTTEGLGKYGSCNIKQYLVACVSRDHTSELSLFAYTIFEH